MLRDIKIHCQYILDDVAGISYHDFVESRVTRQAVERNLEIVGVAASTIRSDNPDLYEDIPELRRAVGLRNRLAHGYGGLIDDAIIWETVQESVPSLLREVNARLNS